MRQISGAGASLASPDGRSRIKLRVEILVVILALRSELHVLVSSFGILENFPFVISDHDFLIVVIQNISRIDRNFAATAGGIDDELRHAITGGVTAQAFDDFD